MPADFGAKVGRTKDDEALGSFCVRGSVCGMRVFTAAASLLDTLFTWPCFLLTTLLLLPMLLLRLSLTMSMVRREPCGYKIDVS
jgi:hypothetical protein